MDHFDPANSSFLFHKKDLFTLLTREKLFLNKERGQNFLVEISIRKKMASFLPENYNIIEIGCGLGHFTAFILPHAKDFVGIELDKGFYDLLKTTFPNASFIHKDFLTCNLQEITNSVTSKNPWILVGNIPYNITGKILEKSIEVFPLFSAFFVLLQKEYVKDKLLFNEGNTELSAIYCKLFPYFSIKVLTVVPADSFFPQPKVPSSFLELTRKNEYFTTYNLFYSKMIDILFMNPKKKLKIAQPLLTKLCQNDNVFMHPLWEKFAEKRIKELTIKEILGIYKLLVGE